MSLQIILNSPDISDLYSDYIKSSILLFREKNRAFIATCASDEEKAIRDAFPEESFTFFGAQKRTHEELVLLALLVQPGLPEFYDIIEEDHVAETTISFAKEITSAFIALGEMDPSDQSSLIHINNLERQIQHYSEKASAVCSKLSEYIRFARSYIAAEGVFFRGNCEASISQIASSKTHLIVTLNGHKGLPERFSFFPRNFPDISSFIEERRQACHMMASLFSSLDNQSISSSLTFLSSYCFSQSSRALRIDDYLSSFLWLFRSMEFSMLSIGVQSGRIDCRVSEGSISYYHDSKKITGAGNLFYSIFSGRIESSPLLKKISLAVIARNSSLVGHGYSHISKSACSESRKDFIDFLNNYMEADFFNRWKRYQRQCKPVTLSTILTPRFFG